MRGVIFSFTFHYRNRCVFIVKRVSGIVNCTITVAATDLHGRGHILVYLFDVLMQIYISAVTAP